MMMTCIMKTLDWKYEVHRPAAEIPGIHAFPQNVPPVEIMS
jgi:hypothetical protein